MLTNKLSSKPETMENAHVLVSCIIRKKGSTPGTDCGPGGVYCQSDTSRY